MVFCTINVAILTAVPGLSWTAIGITQATTVYREGGLSYAATAHPPFCDAGSLPADYRARWPSLSVAPDKHHSFALIGTRNTIPYPRALGGPDRNSLVRRALEHGQRHQGLLSERRLRFSALFTYYSS